MMLKQTMMLITTKQELHRKLLVKRIVVYLHPGTIVTSIANDEMSVLTENSHLARHPQAAGLRARGPKAELNVAFLVENLKDRY
jgi:hypothetical protein